MPIDETPITEHPATGFDVEAWLQDAHLPEESTEVYKRADVIGELSALRRQIELQREAAAAAERTSGETSELATLEARYQALLDTFAGSQLTVYCRAISPDERREVRAASEKATAGKDSIEQNAYFGYELLAKAIIAVKPFEGERTPVSWDAATVRKMENTIGGTQMNAVLQAHQLAQGRMPSVDADFLQKPSGAAAGQGS